ncbi:hypothetical protein GCM10009863_30560 [Streptomyces axinellae]|uniref:Uncharacterized protein n=1 Tax=Streptomyces axinellae TaxID=552788 RepID=A0ABN3Q373_9ACTN
MRGGGHRGDLGAFRIRTLRVPAYPERIGHVRDFSIWARCVRASRVPVRPVPALAPPFRFGAFPAVPCLAAQDHGRRQAVPRAARPVPPG